MPKFSPVSYKQLVKVFEAEGFRLVRTEGDHMVFTMPGEIRPVVIPKFPKYTAIPVFIIKNNLVFLSQMSTSTLVFKAQSLYVAFAPQFGVSAYGGCEDEALNNLTEELRECNESADKTKPSQSR